MKLFSLLIFVVFVFTSCSTEHDSDENGETVKQITIRVPNKHIPKNQLTYNNQTSEWSLGENLFSGYAIELNEHNDTIQKMGIGNGKLENQTTTWFPNGQLFSVANYHVGKLHGEQKRWSMDSSYVQVAHYNYVNGKMHGEQKKWYPTGEIFQILHLNMGQEEGLQQAFRKNGVLFANYEAKEGRVFGLKKAALCFGLENQKIQDEE